MLLRQLVHDQVLQAMTDEKIAALCTILAALQPECLAFTSQHCMFMLAGQHQAEEWCPFGANLASLCLSAM